MPVLLILIIVLVLALYPYGAQEQSVPILAGPAGGTFTYSGHGTANTGVTIELSSSISIATSGNSYLRWFDNLHVASSGDSFVVIAQHVKTLKVTGYFAGVHIVGKTAQGNGDANGNCGLSTSGIPPGSYDIEVTGEPADGASEVVLSVTASRNIQVGPDGTYTASLDMSGLPSGVYLVKQNGVVVAKAYAGVSPPYSCTLNLQAGWNLVSLPIEPENGAIDYIFSPEQQQNIDVIWDFNGGDWKYWTTEPGWPNTFSSLSSQKGYYFYCYNPFSVTIYGSQPGGPVPISSLSQGWNLVGFPSTGSTSVNNVYGSADTVWKFDYGTWTFFTTEADYANKSTLSTLDPSYGYWVYKL